MSRAPSKHCLPSTDLSNCPVLRFCTQTLDTDVEMYGEHHAVAAGEAEGEATELALAEIGAQPADGTDMEE